MNFHFDFNFLCNILNSSFNFLSFFDASKIMTFKLLLLSLPPKIELIVIVTLLY